MNSKILLAITLSVLMMGSAAAMAADSQSPSVGQPQYQLGHYSFNTTGSVVNNLSVNFEDQSSKIVNSMQISGANKSALNTNLNPKMGEDMNLEYMSNATIFSQEKMNTLVFMSFGKGTVPPNMTLNFTEPVKNVTAKVSSGMTFSGSFGSYVQSNLSTGVSWSLFKIENSRYNGFFFTNGKVKVNTTTNESLTTTGSGGTSMLISGFISSGSLNNVMEKYAMEHEHEGNLFNYNNTTGMVTGKFVNFNFNSSSGNITNYEINSSKPMTVFTEINASGNGTIGSYRNFPAFSLNQPVVYGSVFFYANSSYIYAIHNNPALQMGLTLDNGTMTFKVPTGLNVTSFVRLSGSESEKMNSSTVSSNVSADQNQTLGLNHEVEVGTTTFFIHNASIRSFLTVSGVGASARFNSTTNEIVVNTTKSAQINFVSPPGLRSINETDFRDIKYALDHGNLGAQLSIESLNGIAANYTTYYNGSLKMQLLSVSNGQVKIAVSSTSHHGTNVAFFVNKTFLNASSGKIYVSFDGNSITLTSTLNGTLTVNSSTNAYYAVVPEQGGYLVVVHVPHFSNHTIVISDTSLSTSPLNLPVTLSPLELGIVGVAVVAVMAGIVVVIRRR
ncbi:MAG: hypothetical protein M1476_06995 [Candidatus Thermoplasmatota archaeon]|nr:hypothetical protein [Candidatus Thermoplasmatota archaeon]